MTKLLAACALALLCCAAGAQVNPEVAAPPAPVAASQAAPAALPLDPVAATRKFMDRVQGEARVKSDAYSEGGYWLLLWDLLYGLAVAWLLLSRRISTRIRDFAERRTQRRSLQTLIYAFVYIPLTALLTLPMTYYEGFYREHQYGLSNLTFLHWLGEAGIGLGVGMVAGGNRHHRLVRDPAASSADVVGVGNDCRNRLHDICIHDRTGVHLAAFQYLQAGSRRPDSGRDPVAGARQRHSRRQRLLLRRVQADETRERQRERPFRHDPDFAQRQPAQRDVAAGNTRGDGARDGALRSEPRHQADGGIQPVAVGRPALH